MDVIQIESTEASHSSFLSSDPPSVIATATSLTHSPATHRSTSPLSTDDTNTHPDDPIDWDLVTRQLETKLQTSVDTNELPSDKNDWQRISRKKYQFRPINQAISSSTEQAPSSSAIRNHHEQIKAGSTDQKTQTPNDLELRSSTSSTSTLQALFRELILCQERQAFLLEQIQQHLPTRTSSSAFFLPLDTSSSQRSPPVSSLQDAFEQRKSSFIHQSKERVKQIYRHQKKSHQRIIPRLAQCNNSYLQEKRQSEYDRLCTMIIKHQNRQNAKIYGNFIKNRLCFE